MQIDSNRYILQFSGENRTVFRGKQGQKTLPFSDLNSKIPHFQQLGGGRE